jgi:undecaprenyl diphosphate synthase
MRLSNFLLWQLSYAEFHVTPTLWPDFTEADLAAAIRDYAGRQRRLGGLGPEGGDERA